MGQNSLKFRYSKVMRNSGFTLIELVAIIVLLGILAVTALPRFIDLSSGARVSTLEGLAGAIRSAVALQHSIAVINQNNGGLENGFIANGILFDQGYPVALDFDVPFGQFGQGGDPDSTPEILEALSLDLDDWSFAEIVAGSEDGQITRELYVTLSSVAPGGSSATQIIATNCYVSYDSFLLVSRAPVVKIITSGC